MEGLHIYRQGCSHEFRVQNETRASSFKLEFFQASTAEVPLPSQDPWPGATMLGCALNCKLWAVQKSSFKILCVLSRVYKAVPTPVRLTECTSLGYYVEKDFSL